MKDGCRFTQAEHDIESLLDRIRRKSMENPPNHQQIKSALEQLEDAVEELRAAHAEIDSQRDELARACSDLRREHDRYLNLFEEAPDGYVVTDLDGVIRQANRSFSRLSGQKREFILGVPLARFVYGEDNESFYRQLKEIRTVEAVHGWELRFQSTGGIVYWASINIARIPEPEGFGLRWLIRDISARMDSDDLLRRYELLAAHSRDIILLIRNEDGRILEANAASVEAYGYSHEELLAMNIHELRAPHTLPDTIGQMSKAQSRGVLFETFHRRRNGELFPVEVSSRGEVIRGVPTLVSVIRDVTKRKKAEALIQARLTLFEVAGSCSTGELLQKTVDEVCSLTDSPIGFFHFVNKDQETLSLEAWSTSTLEKFCSAEGKGHQYPIAKAGVWVDCVSERRPVIHNDYASLPHRKGLPEGHPPVIRELVVPIIKSGEIVAILGVGNKPEDYTGEDVTSATYLADVAWEITSRKLTDDRLKKAYADLNTTLESITDGFFSLDHDWRITYMNASGAKMLGQVEDPVGKVLWDLFPRAVDLEFHALYHFAVESKRPVHFEEYYPAPLNKWWECHAYPSPEGLSVYFRDVTERKVIEETRLYLAQCCWQAGDEGFFESLARHLAESLRMDFVCIDLLSDDLLSATTLTVYYNGRFEDNLTYTLQDTPCGEVTDKQVCCFQHGVRHLFPRDPVLQEMQAESYLGTTLRDTDGKPIGLIAVIGREPLSNPRTAEAVLQLVAVRASGELQRKLADEALHKSEETSRRRAEELEKIMDLVPAGIMVSHDPQCSCVTGNNEARRMFEVGNGQDISPDSPESEDRHWGRRWFIGERELGPDELPMQQAIATGRDVLGHEADVVFPGGRRKTMLGNATPLLDANGEVRGCLGVCMDITERKHAREALRRSEEQFRLLFETMIRGVLFLDAGGRIVSVNPAGERILGKTASELIMQNHAFLSDDRPVLREDGTPMLLSEHPAVLAMKTGIENKGTVIAVYDPATRDYRWISVDCSPLFRKGDVKPYQIYMIFDDVTERRAAEQALRESEERFRSLFENMTEGVALHEMIYDESGQAVDYRILSINPAFERHTGLRSAEVLGQLATEAYQQSQAPFLAEYIEVAELGGKLTFETWFQPLDRYFQISATSPKKGQFLTVFADTTERKKMEEALRKSHDVLESLVQERTSELRESNRTLREHAARLERLNEELQEFSFIASHDLQEPLRKIQTFGHLLCGMDDKKQDGFRQEYLDRIIGSAARMSNLLESLLDYSRIVSVHSFHGPIDLAEIARQAAADCEVTIKEPEAILEIGELPEIEADPAEMRQLFQNLIENAMRYRRETEKPKIKLYGRTGEGTCTIFVEDNGMGFEEKYLDRIFKPFQQLHNRNSGYGGTGMGLTMCRKIVERHGGTITARSSPGKGATFIVELPLKHTDKAES